jgi:hypothetical protein
MQIELTSANGLIVSDIALQYEMLAKGAEAGHRDPE